MEDMKLKDISIDEFKKDVYSYYLEIFPEDERKPLELIQASYNNHYTRIIKILHKNEMVGFMILNKAKDNGYVILDYLAIMSQYRNSKFGTKALQILIEQEKECRGIFIEVEKVGLGKDIEENLIREKRARFYEKLGFKRLNFDLFLFDVVYTPYVFLYKEDAEDVIMNKIFNIYELISGKERIKQNCKYYHNNKEDKK